MGRVGGVVVRRCRVRARPMPREAGVTRAHAMTEAVVETAGSSYCSLGYFRNAQPWSRSGSGHVGGKQGKHFSRHATRFRESIGLSINGCLVDTWFMGQPNFELTTFPNLHLVARVPILSPASS